MASTRTTAETFMATLEARDWAAWSALLHPDVVDELPQSRERIRGRDADLQFNVDSPGDWHLAPKLVVADADHACVRFTWTVDDGEPGDALVLLAFDRAGAITRVTDFWPEPAEPPPGRDHLVERY